MCSCSGKSKREAGFHWLEHGLGSDLRMTAILKTSFSIPYSNDQISHQKPNSNPPIFLSNPPATIFLTIENINVVGPLSTFAILAISCQAVDFVRFVCFKSRKTHAAILYGKYLIASTSRYCGTL
jgi:hypothetical protein